MKILSKTGLMMYAERAAPPAAINIPVKEMANSFL
jgi:hypothetical protein